MRQGLEAWARRAKRLLRAPRVIVGELVLIAAAGVLSTVFTQLPVPTERARFAVEHPVLAPAIQALRLDRIFGSGWFLGLVGLATGSLGIVLIEQWGRLRREWGVVPGEAAFRTAPLRAEFQRPARGGRSRIATRRKAGTLGSPLFHLGLLIVVLAGAARMLFGADGVAHVYEGERIEARPDAFPGSWSGPLARPVALPVAVRVEALSVERYPAGSLRALEARLHLEEEPPREESLAINTPLDLGHERLYVSGVIGVAALLEAHLAGREERLALLLDEVGTGEYAVSEVLPGGLTLRLRAVEEARGERPGSLELRVTRDGALLAVGRIAPGGELPVPGAGRVKLHDLRWWARFSATRDLSAWPAYAGFALVLAGVILLFAVIRVDQAVLVQRDGEVERVVVALRPQRLAPLFRERFEALVREEGGPVPG